MGGVTITLHNEGVLQLLNGMATRMQSLRPVMAQIGAIVRTSVVQNFEAEGRPTKWQPLAAATVRQRGSAHPILARSGHLLQSINWEADNTSVRVGSNRVYARLSRLRPDPATFARIFTCGA